MYCNFLYLCVFWHVMKPSLFPALACFFCLVLFSCQRDPNVILPGNNSDTLGLPGSNEPDQYTIASVSGKIVDENGEALKNAKVSGGGKVTYTNEYGIFRLYNISVSQQYTVINVSKEGYFNGLRTLLSRTDGNAFIKIKLARKQLTSKFRAASGDVINVQSYAAITFQPNSVVTASGENYDGDVYVYATPIDPTAADFCEIMPGDLRGINADSQAVALRSYGMLNVLLETATGAPLQLAAGSEAAISFQVAESLLSHAPSSIPMWHMNEADGKWREEGKAVLNGGKYLGTVSHFSVWNFDDPLEAVFVSAQIVATNNGVLPYMRMRISSEDGSDFVEGFSDSTGHILTWVPKGVPLIIEIFNQCGEKVYTQQISALNADTDLGTITAPASKFVTVTGTVTDCDNQPAVAVAAVEYQGLYYTAQAVNGVFNVVVNGCNLESTKAYLFAFNRSSGNSSRSKGIELTGTEVNGGTLQVCGSNNADEYSVMRFDNDSVYLVVPIDTVIYEKASETSITVMDKLPVNLHDYAVTVRLIRDTPCVYTAGGPATMVVWKNRNYWSRDGFQYHIKEFGKPGEPIVVSVSGSIQWDVDGTDVHTFSADLRIRRPY